MIVRERPAAPTVALGRTRTAFVPVVWLLALSALAELVLARLFYRVGIFIPKEGSFRLVYRTLTWIGVFAFNLASVLALVAAALLALSAFRRGRRATGYLLSAFLAASVAAILLPGAARGPGLRLLHLVAVSGVAWAFLRSPAALRLRLLVAGVTGAVATSAAAGSSASGGSAVAQLAGEAIVVATGLLALVAWAAEGRPRPGPLLAGLVAAAALLVAWEANGAIAGILVLWTAGLRLYLPIWAYALAFGGTIAAAGGWMRTAPWRSVGLLLLFPAGFLLESTYQQALVLLAVSLLSEGRATGGLPGWNAEREPLSPAAVGSER